MGRQPDHPSGAKQTICIRLPPTHLKRLDELVTRLGGSRSTVLARLIERATETRK